MRRRTPTGTTAQPGRLDRPIEQSFDVPPNARLLDAAVVIACAGGHVLFTAEATDRARPARELLAVCHYLAAHPEVIVDIVRPPSYRRLNRRSRASS